MVFDAGQYVPGDTVDVFHCERYLEYQGAVVSLVRRVALGRIENVTPGARASIGVHLFKAWDFVRPMDRIAPAQHFSVREIDTVIDAPKTIQGAVFERVENTVAPYLYQTFLFDKGAQAGVQTGDIFQIYTKEKKGTNKYPVVSGCVLHVAEHSSTLIIMDMVTEKLAVGDEGKLIKRILFRKQ
jgi:hypothetical protein